jgi:hypothetical protein
MRKFQGMKIRRGDEEEEAVVLTKRDPDHILETKTVNKGKVKHLKALIKILHPRLMMI